MMRAVLSDLALEVEGAVALIMRLARAFDHAATDPGDDHNTRHVEDGEEIHQAGKSRIRLLRPSGPVPLDLPDAWHGWRLIPALATAGADHASSTAA